MSNKPSASRNWKEPSASTAMPTRFQATCSKAQSDNVKTDLGIFADLLNRKKTNSHLDCCTNLGFMQDRSLSLDWLLIPGTAHLLTSRLRGVPIMLWGVFFSNWDRESSNVSERREFGCLQTVLIPPDRAWKRRKTSLNPGMVKKAGKRCFKQALSLSIPLSIFICLSRKLSNYSVVICTYTEIKNHRERTFHLYLEWTCGVRRAGCQTASGLSHQWHFWLVHSWLWCSQLSPG